jgi:serine/threonine-protein kinase RsbT
MAERTVMEIASNEDVVMVRQAARRWAQQLGLSLVETTKIVTAASELARNTLEYGGGGQVTLEIVQRDGRRGLSLVFEDQGPGIADIALAMRDGFSTGNGLGLGLSGAKRLVHDFDIYSAVGKGTKVSIVRWR